MQRHEQNGDWNTWCDGKNLCGQKAFKLVMLTVILLPWNWASWITKRGTKSSSVSWKQVRRSRMKLELTVIQALGLCFSFYICFTLSYSHLLPGSIYVLVISCFLTTTLEFTGFKQQPLFGIPQKPGLSGRSWAVLLLCIGVGWGHSCRGAQMSWYPQGDCLLGQAVDFGMGWDGMGVQAACPLECLSSLPCCPSWWSLGFPQHWKLALKRGHCKCAKAEVTRAQRPQIPADCSHYLLLVKAVMGPASRRMKIDLTCRWEEWQFTPRCFVCFCFSHSPMWLTMSLYSHYA